MRIAVSIVAAATLVAESVSRPAVSCARPDNGSRAPRTSATKTPASLITDRAASFTRTAAVSLSEITTFGQTNARSRASSCPTRSRSFAT